MAKYDLGSAATGALTGAATGSIFGPIGTGVGAVVGGTAGLFGSKKKKKKKPNRISTLDPQQQALYDDSIQGLQGKGQFADLYNFNPEQANAVFDANVSRPAYRNFNENVIPSITGQYRKGNLMNSSYSAEALSRAGRDVQEGLDAQRSAALYQGSQDALNRKTQGIDRLLNTQTFAYENPEDTSPGGVDQILNKLGPMAGDWFADYLKQNTQRGASNAATPTG